MVVVIVPSVERFSFPKDMAPELSVMDPLARVKFPMLDPVAAETVPPKEIAPLLSVMDPLARVKFPMLDPVAAETIPVNLVSLQSMSQWVPRHVQVVLVPSYATRQK